MTQALVKNMTAGQKRVWRQLQAVQTIAALELCAQIGSYFYIRGTRSGVAFAYKLTPDGYINDATGERF